MLKTLQEGGAYNRELVMSEAWNREVVCFLEGEVEEWKTESVQA